MNREALKHYFFTLPWWGRIACAFFGYLLAGPAGSIFGLLIGNLFDKGLAQYFNNPYLRYYYHVPHAVKRPYCQFLFMLMGHIAKSDGRVNQAEIEFSKKVMKELRFNRLLKQYAIQAFMLGKKNDFDLSKTLNDILILCNERLPLKQLLIEILYSLATKDKLTPYKQQQLNRIFIRLGFTPIFAYQQAQGQYENFKFERAFSSSGFNEDYQLFGINSDASKQEVKRAFRKKISQYHPDKLVSRGASTEQIKAATEKTQQLYAAYDRIKKAKGF